MEASALRAPAAPSRLPVPAAFLRLRSDEQLVALFRAGNETAFGVIHDRYRTRMFAYARQMLGGSRTDAEDVLQDVFLRAYNALRVDDRPVALRAWLYRVAHNRCIDHLRRPQPRDEDVFDLSRSPVHDPLAEAERRDDLRRLIADVQALPAQQRSALLMREMEGLSYADLAGALDVSVPAVKSLLVRARIGLVESAEARDAACADIRADLAAACDRGVRTSGRARRHLRECSGCREYGDGLRSVRAGLHALSPGGGPLALLAQILGLGGAGSIAGGSAIVGGGGALAGAGATATTAKVAAAVASAALAAGGAVEVGDQAQRQREAATASAPAPVLRAPDRALAPDRVAAIIARPTVAPRTARTTSAPAPAPRTVAAPRPVRRVPLVPPGEPISPHYAEPAPAVTPAPTKATTTDGEQAGTAKTPGEGSSAGSTGTADGTATPGNGSASAGSGTPTAQTATSGSGTSSGTSSTPGTSGSSAPSPGTSGTTTAPAQG